MTKPKKTNVVPIDFTQGIEKHWEVPETTVFGTRSMISLELQKHASLGLTDDEARHLTPELGKFVNGLESDIDSTYQIVIPIGVGEIWGVNFRGDLVYRDQMIPDVNSEAYLRRPYGYPTFETGHFFAHHKNKPGMGHPILGDIPFVAFNPKMQWVELVVRAHLPAVEEHYPDLLSPVISGQFPVSMGLLAVADVCLKCGNVRKGPAARPCKHITSPRQGGELGRIYADGSVAGMSNVMPRFFDLSAVKRGADSIGFALKKVATADEAKKVETIIIRDAIAQMKQKGLLDKVKAVPKKDEPGELEKYSKVKQAVTALSKEEPDIEPTALLKQAKAGGLGLLDAMAMAGMMLRPHEFQTAYLGATHPVKAGELALARRTFPMSPTDLVSMPAMSDLPFQIAPSGVKIWVGQNLSPWKSWDAQMLIHRMLAPQPVIQPVTPQQAWAPNLNEPGLKQEYMKFLAKALAAVIEKAAAYTGPDGLEFVTDSDALEVQKEASLGALAAVLPAMYFAKLLGSDVAAGAMPGIGSSRDLTGSGKQTERSLLQKIIMFNPFLATSFAGVAGRGGGALVNKLDDLLLRRLIKT